MTNKWVKPLNKTVIALTAIASLASASVATAVSSEAKPRSSYQSAMISYAMAKHHLSEPAAQAFLASQAKQLASLDSLKDKGVKTDGAYFDSTNKLTLIAEGRSAAIARSHGFHVKQGAGNSALQTQAAVIARRVTRLPQVSSVRADLPSGKIRVTVTPGTSTAVRAQIQALGKNIALVEAPKAQMQSDVLAGQDMNMPSPAGWRRMCTTGFPATLKNGNAVMLTAGHCTQDASLPINNASGTHIGKVLDSRYAPGTTMHDYGLIDIDSDDTPQGYVDTRGAAGYIPVAGMSENAVGTQLCKEGRTTGWTCGEITGYNATINFGNGTNVSGLMTTSVCTQSGDSGGPFIGVGNLAQGVLSGGSSGVNCGAFDGGYAADGQGESYVVPIVDLAHYYGATLVTGK